MVSYSYYTGTYKGDSIPETEWESYEQRAQYKLARYKRIYTVTAPDEHSEDNAVCAMADTMYFYDAAANGYTSRQIGSVSSSNNQIDLSERAQNISIYRAALEHVDIYRGASHA